MGLWRPLGAGPMNPSLVVVMTVSLRVIAAVGGGYTFTAALVALLAVTLSFAPIARSEAVTAAALLGYLLYLAVLLWCFSVRSVTRLWALLASGTMLASVLAFFLQ